MYRVICITLLPLALCAAADTIEVVAGQVIFMPPEPAGKPRLIARLMRRLERTVRRGGAGDLLADTPFILEGEIN